MSHIARIIRDLILNVECMTCLDEVRPVLQEPHATFGGNGIIGRCPICKQAIMSIIYKEAEQEQGAYEFDVDHNPKEIPKHE